MCRFEGYRRYYTQLNQSQPKEEMVVKQMSAELCPTVNIPGRRVTSRHEPPISAVMPTGTSRGMHKVAEGVCVVSRCSVYITALWSGAYMALWSALHMLRCE